MVFSRREFLGSLPFFLSAPVLAEQTRELKADIAIIGGGLGGVAATLAACRHGAKVILTEETDWIGGQLTSQAVPPDEHQWVESHGITKSYRQLRNSIRDYYRANRPLTELANSKPNLNPGEGSVSRLCHEPLVALAVMGKMLEPFVESNQLIVLREHVPTAADLKGDQIRTVTVRSTRWANEVAIAASYFLDATEPGDLLPIVHAEFVTGCESQKETQEPHAPPVAQPENQQAFTQCFAIEYRPGEDHTISKPNEYEFWRNYVPNLKPPWPGKLLSWSMSDPVSLNERKVHFDPTLEAKAPGLNLWVYRRLASKNNFVSDPFHEITLVNWSQNDYWLGNLVGVSPVEKTRNLRRSKSLSLALLHWMQTEAPRPGGGTGWKGLRLRKDIVGTDDGLAKYPYIRESRRIKAEFTIVEQHVGIDARMKVTGKSREGLTAEAYPDSVGIGYYRIDLHPSTGGNNYIDVASLPFQIPLGALIPIRMENLLPACKNIGTTHITNGCYRLHPVEWNIGEAAGALAAFCLKKKMSPRAVRAKALAEFQQLLTNDGVDLAWRR